MSQQAISPESGPTLPPLSYKDTPVLTTELLAIAYEVEEHQIRQNFKNNKDRFIEGKHYFSVTGEELAAFRLCVENFYPQISPKARVLTLWTERGAARHAKMLNSDKAWDVFELLEETFFAVAKPAKVKSEQAGPDTPIGPADQNILQTIVKTKVGALLDAAHKGGFPQIWSRFNNHFRLGSYKQLPQSKMAEAVEYLIKLEVRERKELPRQKELPASRDKYEAYIDRVEEFRARTVAEMRLLLGEGLELVDVFKLGTDGIAGFSPIIQSWLREVAIQPTPLVAPWHDMERAIRYSPFCLMKRMEEHWPGYDK